MRYLAVLLFVVFSFFPKSLFAQAPNIYVISENMDGTSKSFRYVISYGQVEVYSLEVDDEGGYPATFSAYDIRLIARKRINPIEYSDIKSAIDSTLILPEGSPNAPLGGYHWSIKYIGTKDQIFSKRYFNVQEDYFIAVRESVINELGFIQQIKFRKIYRNNLFKDF